MVIALHVSQGLSLRGVSDDMLNACSKREIQSRQRRNLLHSCSLNLVDVRLAAAYSWINGLELAEQQNCIASAELLLRHHNFSAPDKKQFCKVAQNHANVQHNQVLPQPNFWGVNYSIYLRISLLGRGWLNWVGTTKHSLATSWTRILSAKTYNYCGWPLEPVLRTYIIYVLFVIFRYSLSTRRFYQIDFAVLSSLIAPLLLRRQHCYIPRLLPLSMRLTVWPFTGVSYHMLRLLLYRGQLLFAPLLIVRRFFVCTFSARKGPWRIRNCRLARSSWVAQ